MTKARVRKADRSQLRWDMVDLDSQLPLGHRARIVWAFVECLDLEDLYASVCAREGVAGRCSFRRTGTVDRVDRKSVV